MNPYEPYAPYAPPPADLPPVWRWYKVYVICMALMYLVVTVLGVVMAVIDIPTRDNDLPMDVQGVLLALICVPFFLIYAAALFVPRKPWAWVFHLVLICVGLTSACCAPASIPLLIFWLKPETKAAFGRPPG